jgi:hypothetical protein
MQKLAFSIGAVIALFTILLVPGISTHIAKASSCSTSFQSKGLTGHISITSSGSCSFSFAGSQFIASVDHATGKSSCSSDAASSTNSSGSGHSSNSGVSCASHSP